MDRHGVRPDPEAVEAVLTWKAPRMDTQLLSFLGFAKYYREFNWNKEICPGRLTVKKEGEFRIKTRDKKICPGSLL